MDVTPHASVAEYFHGVLTDALERQAVAASQPTELYLVSLLGEFAHARITDEPLSLKLAAAEPAERVRALKEVGDTTLYMTGLFGESLRRGIVATDYYIGLGEAAYRELSARLSGSTVQQVFGELAAKFPRFVEVLQECGKSFHFSGDEWIERRLRSLGMLVSADRC
jgi:hypothetical protein